MPISQSRYVDIISGIGGASLVPNRNLGGLVISFSNLVPTGSVISFTSAAAVGLYFGTSSGEYTRAVFYFGWISKSITTPQLLSFYFWNQNTATASLIFGAQGPYALSTFTAITSGSLTLTLGGFTNTITGINLSAAGSLAAVATAIQTAIRTYTAGGTAWTGATVAYSATGAGQFNLTSGATGTDVIAVGVSSGTDVANAIGWESASTVTSNGTGAQTITQALNILIGKSNNFGSFCFGSTSVPTLQNLIDVAAWNYSLNPNIQFIFSVRVTAANASTWQTALKNYGGCTMTLAPLSGEYPEMCPMMILAATDYTARNSVQNYEFQIFNLTPSVSLDADANTYDALGINYYGQTQTAGQLLQFYQTGVMFGLAVDPSDQNVYANEIWFKDAMAAVIMNLLLALTQIPANLAGKAQLLGVVQSPINQALNNGTIEPGKTLTIIQQLYISQITGDANAWKQVQNIGYWIDFEILPFIDSSGKTKYKAVYTFVYSKDDTIRLVQGSEILI